MVLNFDLTPGSFRVKGTKFIKNKDNQRLLADLMFMIVHNCRLFFTAGRPTAVTPTALAPTVVIFFYNGIDEIFLE